MSSPVPRTLNERERAILSAVLAHLGKPDAVLLDRQLSAARVVGGLPTLLDIEVSESAERAACRDGPLPVRSGVTADNGEPIGEILVWATRGYLSSRVDRAAGLPGASCVDLSTFSRQFAVALLREAAGRRWSLRS